MKEDRKVNLTNAPFLFWGQEGFLIKINKKMVGAHGFEPWTSSLSVTRSDQLSYAPFIGDGSRFITHFNTIFIEIKPFIFEELLVL